MTERLDELERLARLRASGALTDDEFEREKCRLLDDQSESRGRAPIGIRVLVVAGALLAMVTGILMLVGTPAHDVDLPPGQPAPARIRALPAEGAARPGDRSAAKADQVSAADQFIRAEREPADSAVKLSVTFDNCLNTGLAADGVNSEMIRCTVDEYDRQDSRLNQTYQMKLGDLPQRTADELRRRQRLWIARMKRKCEDENREVEGGSMWPLLISECRAFETTRRRMWIERIPA